MLLDEKLLDLRKKSGLSQEEVAEKLNVSRQKIYELYDACKNELGFNDVENILVLKDILYQKYRMEIKKK